MNVTTQSSAVGQRSYHHQPPSLYVINSFYEWVVEVSADLARIAVRDSAAVKAARVDEITRLLTLEARLLDQGTLAQENQRALAQEAYGHWLALFADECAYWIPANIPAADPRQTVALEFHDRRRLLDRVARLGTGFAFSQSPASHTSRQWSGLEFGLVRIARMNGAHAAASCWSNRAKVTVVYFLAGMVLCCAKLQTVCASSSNRST